MTSAVAVRAAAAPKRRADFALLALAMSAAVFLGFWFTYFGPMAAGSYPKVSPLVHVHGWSFFAWYLLLPLQAGLIRSRQVQWHRTLGSASVALAFVMVITGMTVLGVQMRAALASTEFSFWLVAGPAILSTLVLFAAFYTAAFVLRRKSALHKRLIIVASAAGMGAAVFRILAAIFGQVMWILPAGIGLTNLFIVAGMVIDFVRERRIHRAYAIGLPVCVGVELAFFLATPTPVGQAISRTLSLIGGVLGVVY